MSDRLVINKGSDIQVSVRWPDTNLTGYTVSLYDVTPNVTLAAEITDAANGLIMVTGEWNNAYMDLPRIWFRVVITQSGYDQATQRIVVDLR